MSMNPFQQVKDRLSIETLKEVAKKNKKRPIQMNKKLVNDAYKRLRQITSNRSATFCQTDLLSINHIMTRSQELMKRTTRNVGN